MKVGGGFRFEGGDVVCSHRGTCDELGDCEGGAPLILQLGREQLVRVARGRGVMLILRAGSLVSRAAFSFCSLRLIIAPLPYDLRNRRNPARGWYSTGLLAPA